MLTFYLLAISGLLKLNVEFDARMLVERNWRLYRNMFSLRAEALEMNVMTKTRLASTSKTISSLLIAAALWPPH